MDILKEASAVLPYKIMKKIKKTAEGRSNLEIIKRRNRRSYRALLQYSTWNSLKQSGDPNRVLEKYQEGYLVYIKPEEYFGNNYPEKSDDLNNEFVLGETGFVFYTQASEYEKYHPLPSWSELIEISTRGSADPSTRTWYGDYCCDIKNRRPKIISEICSSGDTNQELKERISREYGVNLEDVPAQRGIANYDYDYAAENTIEDVELQMLYLMLVCQDDKGTEFCKYIKGNYEEILSEKDTRSFAQNIQSDEYEQKFAEFFKNLKAECSNRGLLEKEQLKKINAWSGKINRPICPLCSKPLTPDLFFKEIEQQEGRQVPDNTQSEIVLMHIKALRPGEFNHITYNLGWGHNYCNTIQKDSDIEEVIKNLDEIVKSYYSNLKN